LQFNAEIKRQKFQTLYQTKHAECGWPNQQQELIPTKPIAAITTLGKSTIHDYDLAAVGCELCQTKLQQLT
jgi:hypothetical protein